MVLTTLFLMMLRFIRYIFYGFLAAAALIGLNYAWVSVSTKAFLYDNIAELPQQNVALVLGTNKYLRRGHINQYYQNRIDTAAKLYHAGKVDYFIVSGDNRKNNYNEPKQMRADLIKAGVPATHIQPDYAGLRTLDSVLRMQKVFGHSQYLIISQPFHNQRAVFLAHAKGQSPIAFNAPNPATQGMTKVIAREFLARVKAVLDLVSNKQAKHYGNPIIFPPN